MDQNSKNVVTRGIHDPAPVLLDKFCSGVSAGFQRPNCCLLALTHETGVSFDISTENSGEFAFKTFLSH